MTVEEKSKQMLYCNNDLCPARNVCIRHRTNSAYRKFGIFNYNEKTGKCEYFLDAFKK